MISYFDEHPDFEWLDSVEQMIAMREQIIKYEKALNKIEKRIINKFHWNMCIDDVVSRIVWHTLKVINGLNDE
jgi:hypothetical protein